MCGIFGQNVRDPKRINSSNIKILGMFNESRGKHSCGITIDSEIYHGLDKYKLFTDFIKGKTFKAENNPLIIGHTRSASIGAAISEHNAHPFGFGTNATGGFKFIGVHNGTLYNHLELAKDYGIETKAGYKSQYGVDLERTKIDSEILLEIIYTTKSYKVLSEYIGKAALVWTDTDTPNVTYLWSGQSRMTEHYLAGLETEERPMNIWIEGRNSFYFSSMPESLEAIGAPEKDVFQIDYNTVYRITNGDFKHAELTKVSRKQCFQTETYVSKHSNYNTNAYTPGKSLKGSENEINEEDYCDWTGHNTRFDKVSPGPSANLNEKLLSVNIYHDAQLLNQNDYGNRVYGAKLRYWQKGHLIEGVFCYVPHYGFYKLGDSQNEATQVFNSNKGLRFYSGDFQKNKAILLGTIPFPIGPMEPMLYYFVCGIMVQSELDYRVAMTTPTIKSDSDKLSHISKHPIINLRYSYKSDNKQDIVKNGEVYTGTINNLGFEKIYHVVQGNLIKVINKASHTSTSEEEVIKKIELPETTKDVFNPKIIEEATKNIKLIEEKIVEKETLEKIIDKEPVQDNQERITDSLITEMIDNEITPCLMSFQNCREELDLLPATHPRVTVAKVLIHDLIQTINQFVN